MGENNWKYVIHVSMFGVLTELLRQDIEIHLAILVPSVAPISGIAIAIACNGTRILQ